MSLTLISLKVAVPVGTTGAVIGGGGAITYFLYKDHQSNSSAVNIDTLKTNLFIARVKATSTETGAITNPVNCKIGADPASKTFACSIYKFTTTKTNNNIAKFAYSTLSKVSAANTDLTTNSFVVVELMSDKLGFTDLKNKTIEVTKTDSTTPKLVDLEFDQLLKPKKNADLSKNTNLDIIPRATKTFLVEKKTDASGTGTSVEPTNYRCKYPVGSADTGKIINIDDSCKLIAMPTLGTDETITTFTKLKEANTLATKENLTNSGPKYFKLEVDQNKLYNLNFEAATTDPEVTIEIIGNNTVESSNPVATFTLKQKFDGEAFVGKTDLVLAKVTEPKTDATGAITGSKCNFNKTTTSSDQFDCSLYAFTEKAGETASLEKATIATSESSTADATTFAANKYFLIKLTSAKPTNDLTKDKKIYYQIAKTESGATTHHIIELTIMQLLSGEIGSDKKPIFITNY